MNRFSQHIPTFCDNDGKTFTDDFSTTEQLLAFDVVKRFAKTEKFSHFAMKGNALLAVSDEGFHWWVVGFVADPASINLPQWSGWKFKARLPNGVETVLSTEVVSSCGDVLTLRDGSKAICLSD